MTHYRTVLNAFYKRGEKEFPNARIIEKDGKKIPEDIEYMLSEEEVKHFHANGAIKSTDYIFKTDQPSKTIPEPKQKVLAPNEKKRAAMLKKRFLSTKVSLKTFAKNEKISLVQLNKFGAETWENDRVNQ